MATETIEITVRPAQPSDLQAGAPLIYEGFKAAADRHGFEPDFPSVEIAASMTKIFLNHPQIFGVAAEVEGKLAGLGFLQERNEIRSIGPVVVDPQLQNRGIGGVVFKKLLERGQTARGVRLVYDTGNPLAAALAEKQGFGVKEPLFLMYGSPRGEPTEAYTIRPMRNTDLAACNELCNRVHSYDRAAELADAMTHFGAVVLIRRGRIVAYASAPSLWIMNHGVAETDKDLKALILHSGLIKEAPLSLLVPGRNNEFFRWCLSVGLRIAKPMTLVSTGFYQEPRAPWYPSIDY